MTARKHNRTNCEQEAIERHLPPEEFEILKAAEESEREIISWLVGKRRRR